MPSPTRSRTPSDLKWLLNERAALAGAVQSADQALPVLQHRLQQLENQLALVREQLVGMEAARARHAETLLAIETTLQLGYPQVNPAAAGVVDAWAGKYGKRGALREFVLGAVQSASPSPVATSAIVQGLASHFGLPAVTLEDRYRLRMKVRGILRCARQEGLVQPLHERSGRVGLWVWASAPTLADLSAAATLLAGTGDDHNSNPHPV